MLSHEIKIAVEKGNIQRLKELIEAGENVNAVDEVGNSLFLLCAWHNQLEMMKYLQEVLPKYLT